MHRLIPGALARQAVLSAGLLGLAGAAAPALHAQTAYPSRPIVMVVPQAAGGTNDIVDPVKDFRPVSLIGAMPNVLLVHPSFSAKSIPELLALAKGKPGLDQYASAG